MSKNSADKPARILIVDDEGIIARDLKQEMIALGYDVCGTALSGEAALEITERERPDLVLMDIVLAGEMDGIQTADAIREKYHIPVVFITAYADQERLKRAKLTYPFGYIIKPFQSRELGITVEMALFVGKAVRHGVPARTKMPALHRLLLLPATQGGGATGARGAHRALPSPRCSLRA